MMKFYLLFSMLLLTQVYAIGQSIDLTITESNNGVPGSAEAICSDPTITVSFKWLDDQGNVLLEEMGSSSTISGLALGSTYCLHATSFDIACDLSMPAEMYECFTITGNSCDGFPVSLQVLESDKNSPICSCCEDGFMSISLDVIDEICWRPTPNTSLDYTLRWLDNNSGSGARNGLSVGRYCVEMIISPDESCEPGCKRIECFEIESSRESPLEISSIKGNICKSSILHTDDDPNTIDVIELVVSNGWISISPSFGDGAYSIQWFDGSNAGFDRIISEPGEYCALISDQCGDEIVECWEVEVIETDVYCIAYPGYLNLDPLSTSSINGLFAGLTTSWSQFPNAMDVNADIHALFSSYENEKVVYRIEEKYNNEVLGFYELERISTPPVTSNINRSKALDQFYDSNEILDVKIFPNPASAIVNIEINAESYMTANIELFNIHGRRVFSESIELIEGINRSKILVDHLPSGLYFVNVDNKFYSKISIVR